jgi:hypothetical protein
MPHPFAPILGFLGIATVGGSKKRRRKNQSNANGTSTQRKGNRALDIIRIQRGLPRDQEPSSETADEVAATPTTSAGAEAPSFGGPSSNGASNAPHIRVAKAIGNDTVGMTTDGKRGYVGAQWWTRSGRNMLAQIRRRHPAATPDEAISLLLKQAVPSVDWEAETLPRGAQMLERRLRRLVEAAYMGRDVPAQTPPVHPQAATPPNAETGAQEVTEAPSPMAGMGPGPVPGMPVAQPPSDIEGQPSRGMPSGIEVQPEPGSEPESGSVEAVEAGPAEAGQEGAQAPQPGKTRRGSRGGRGGKRERKAAAAAAAAKTEVPTPEASGASAPEETVHDTPEGDGGGAGGNSDAPSPDADAPSGE